MRWHRSDAYSTNNTGSTMYLRSSRIWISVSLARLSMCMRPFAAFTIWYTTVNS